MLIRQSDAGLGFWLFRSGCEFLSVPVRGVSTGPAWRGVPSRGRGRASSGKPTSVGTRRRCMLTLCVSAEESKEMSRWKRVNSKILIKTRPYPCIRQALCTLLSTVIMVKELLPQSGQHRRFCSSVVTRPCHFFCCCETCIVRHFFGCRRCDDRQHQNPFVFSSQLPNLVKPLTIMALSMDGELDSWPPRIFSSPSSTDADDWPLGWRRRKTLPVTHTRTRRATPLSADLRGGPGTGFFWSVFHLSHSCF